MEMKRCIGCMEDMAEATGNFCPFCGYDNARTAPQPPYALRPNAILHGRYLVGRVLGQGGFGITYIGFDLVLSVKVAIKEYFPMGAATRSQGKSNTLCWNSNHNTEQRQEAYDSFLKEARKTAKIDQIPSIVRVRDTFYENETAYIVMDYVEGVNLKEKLKAGLMSYSECMRLLTPMMEGLAKVHEMGLIHRDISPDNIMVQPDGSVKLLDLGAARDMSVNKGPQSQLVTKNGFSPLEQYAESGQIGPWTDVYALSATIYYCVTGKTLPSALDRMNQPELDFSGLGKGALPASAAAALKAGLEVDHTKRTQSVGERLSQLNGAVPKRERSGGTQGNDTPVRKKKWLIPTIASVAAVLVLLGGGIFAYTKLVNPEEDGEIRSRGEDTTEGTEESLEESPEPEVGLYVEQMGISSPNSFNYGGYAVIPDEYEYYVGGDNALYACAKNQEKDVFYLEDAPKIHDSCSYINLGADESVYFLTWDSVTQSVCRMDKDGGNLQTVLSLTDGRGYGYLQYALLSDGREYLYYQVENEVNSRTGNLYRYDLSAGTEEVVIEGDLWWYTLYKDSVYYTDVVSDGTSITKLMKADLEGQNIQELDAQKDLMWGFAEADKLYLWSIKDEAILVYGLDGTQDESMGGFYDIAIDSGGAFTYVDDWILYTSMADGNIHRIRANGTGDSVFIEGHSAIYICLSNSWLWFIEGADTGKSNQYANQMYVAYKDGTNLLEIFEPSKAWGLGTPYAPDFQYVDAEDGSGVVITGYTGDMTSFEVPEELGGKPVVGIGDGAFQESAIEQIAFPEGLQYIGEDAFRACENLTFVGLPDSLTEIGRSAFRSCGKLTEADLPEGLVTIGNMAFLETRLSRVYIPASVEKVGAGAFAVWNDAGLTEFVVAPENAEYETREGVLYSGEILEAFPSGAVGSFTIPDDIQGIQYYAFVHCRELTELIIPESVILIGENVFFDSGLTEISISSQCVLKGDLGKDDLTVNRY
ncbi:MAG: leucine-rich repeat protein [Lachnospiraceae bacterium]|nr:leucine-rich repeat protein [Lachnospiraceae bacterium]